MIQKLNTHAQDKNLLHTHAYRKTKNKKMHMGRGGKHSNRCGNQAKLVLRTAAFIFWGEESWIRTRIGVSGAPQPLCGNIYATPHIFVCFPGLWGSINNKQLQLPSEKLNFGVAALNIYSLSG